MKNLIHPIEFGEQIISGYSLKQATMGMLEKVKKTIDTGRFYKAVSDLIEGCIDCYVSIDNEEIEKNVHDITRKMTYQSAEEIFIRIFAEMTGDKFDGYYRCPRCGEKLIFEQEEEFDNRESVYSLEIKYCSPEDYEKTFTLEFDNPVQIKINSSLNGEGVEEISKIEFEQPTLQKCIEAEFKKSRDDFDQQYRIYSSCIVSVDGTEPSQGWRSSIGSILFKKFTFNDIKKMNEEVFKYGIKKTLKKECPECGKVWDAEVDTTNFFVSALQSV